MIIKAKIVKRISMADKFFELLPNAVKHDGKPELCTKDLGWTDPDGECPCDTCKECWNRPYEERFYK